jgi:hypothetical protein
VRALPAALFAAFVEPFAVNVLEALDPAFFPVTPLDFR